MTDTTSTTLTGTARFTSWDEEPAPDAGAPVPRLAHAVAVFAYQGDIEATSTCHYVLHYQAADAGAVTGLERVTAADGGVVVLRDEGSFGPDGVEISWAVVPGTASGSLAGLAGARGGYAAGPHVREWAWRLGPA